MNYKLEKVLELIKKNQLDNAKNECSILISKNSKDPEILNLYAIICFQLEEYDEAIDNWKKSVKSNPKYFFGYNNIGKAFLSLKKLTSISDSVSKF